MRVLTFATVAACAWVVSCDVNKTATVGDVKKANSTSTPPQKKKGKDYALKLRAEMERKDKERAEVKQEKRKAEKEKAKKPSSEKVVPVPPQKQALEEEDEDEAQVLKKSRYTPMTADVVSVGTTYSTYSVQASMESHKGDVLLLHGNSFTHSIWKELETMDRIREEGFRPTSVDLPGKGLTFPSAPLPARGQWLADYITTMKLKNPIVVAPSLSGTYALPLLFNQPSVMKGLVTIAPSGALRIPDEQWGNVTVPVYIMFGAKDALAYVAAATMFRNIPNPSMWKAVNGTHAFYVNRGAEFNRRLVRFIKQVHNGSLMKKAKPATPATQEK